MRTGAVGTPKRPIHQSFYAHSQAGKAITLFVWRWTTNTLLQSFRFMIITATPVYSSCHLLLATYLSFVGEERGTARSKNNIPPAVERFAIFAGSNEALPQCVCNITHGSATCVRINIKTCGQ